MLCCRGRSLNFTNNLNINRLFSLFSYTIPPSQTPLSFLPTDHEISHQWSGNPYSWDSINQHQRKQQRFLVKLLTNILNTKRLTLKMTSAQVIETSVTNCNNSSFQNYSHPDDHTMRTTDTPGFKPFTMLLKLLGII